MFGFWLADGFYSNYFFVYKINYKVSIENPLNIPTSKISTQSF